MKHTYIGFIFIIILFTSCATTEKITYLQDRHPDNVKTNELIKTVTLKDFQYKIQPSDRLHLNIFSLTDEKINFFKNPEMDVLVDANGQIELPVIGLVTLSGMSIKEAEEKLKKVTSEYLKSPSVSIKLLNFNYTIIGEVNKQGSFNAIDPKINILEAIGQAGGLTENANRENIRIIRNENSKNGTTAKVYKINLLEDNSLVSPNYFLQSNDIVLVNPLKANAARQQRISNLSLVVSLATSAGFLIYQLFRK